MRKSIMRSIAATTIESANIRWENGAFVPAPNAPLTVNGKITEEKALKMVRKKYGTTANITALTAVNAVYEISVEDFMKHAKKIEAPAAKQG